MFSKALLTFAAVATTVVSTPLKARTFGSGFNSGFGSGFDSSFGSSIGSSDFISFDNFGGLSTLSSFDSFFGVDNFSGFQLEQELALEQDLACSSIDVNFVQQRLSILSELFKEVLLEQVCEVEVQQLLFSQFLDRFSSFGDSILRESDIQFGFDSSITGLFDQLFLSDGSLSVNDLGFSGSDIGLNSIIPTGSNWNDATSPQTVQNVLQQAQQAAQQAAQQNNVSTSNLNIGLNSNNAVGTPANQQAQNGAVNGNQSSD